MNKTVKRFLIALSIVVLIIAVLIFIPVPIVVENKVIVEKGIVAEIYVGQGNDIVFILENNKRRFYINRGLENGLELNGLKKKLIGNLITIKYPKYWTPLDWNNTIKHISKVEFNDEVLFNKLKK